MHCAVSAFGAWTACTKSCGTGSQSRSRAVTGQAAHGGYVCPYLAETRVCNDASCPMDCKHGSFSAWSTCTMSCGGGAQTRSRTLVQPSFGGKACSHNSEVATCNTFPCSVNCVTAGFDAWSTCTKSCGTGSQQRSRATVEPTFGGKACPHSAETRACNAAACATDCSVAGFGAWSTCTKSCGVGSQKRSRANVEPTFGGKACPHSAETRTCNSHACPINCKASAFGSYSTCTKSCGTGSQQRSRATVAPTFGGKACPHSSETRTCNNAACAADCTIAAWSAWSVCTASCGTGSQLRSRPLEQPRFGGKACPHASETRACNSHVCAVDCSVGAWAAWSTCTKSCGTGSQRRSRVNLEPAAGGKACPHSEETRDCNSTACPVDCVTQDWGEWGACSAKCNGGVQTRTRPTFAPKHGGKACPHNAETKKCNAHACDCLYSPTSIRPDGWTGPGFGKKYCNVYKCNAGTFTLVGMEKQCGVPTQSSKCTLTSCVYGYRISGEIITRTQALSYGLPASELDDMEPVTLVKHHWQEPKGIKYSCGHNHHINKCTCMCFKAKTGGRSHIWHLARKTDYRDHPRDIHNRVKIDTDAQNGDFHHPGPRLGVPGGDFASESPPTPSPYRGPSL